MCSQPPDRPKPPDGDSWLDYALDFVGRLRNIDPRIAALALAELKELRAKAGQIDLCQRAVDALIERKYEDVEAWADQLAKDVCNATD